MIDPGEELTVAVDAGDALDSSEDCKITGRIIISGTGRCGTSVLAAFCHKVGISIYGAQAMDPEIRGGYEGALPSLTIEQIEIVTKAGEPLVANVYVDRIKECFYNGINYDPWQETCILKCPKFFQNNIKEDWLMFQKALAPKEMQVIICYRDFLYTARSFKKYKMSEFAGVEEYTEKDVITLADRLERRFTRNILYLLDLGIDFTFIRFPHFLYEYNKIYNVLTDFAKIKFDYDKGLKIWNDLIETDGYDAEIRGEGGWESGRLKNSYEVKVKANIPCFNLVDVGPSDIEAGIYDPYMIVDLKEAVKYTTLENKITVIIPTYQAPMNCFLWSIFSLLLRAKPDDLIEHFIVVINGPDKRTGDPANQDKKQQFLEELRKLRWYHQDKQEASRDMPMTVTRVWSRIGHPESVEMVLPWVHTDAYLIMHDDIIIKEHDWLREVEDKFYGDEKVIITHSMELMCCQCDSNTHQNQPLLRFPHLLCTFLICKTADMQKLGSSWCGYHIELPEKQTLKQMVGDVNEFKKYYRNMGLLDNPPQETEPYKFISMEMGAWHFYNAIQAGYNFSKINPDLIHHFGAMSWEIEAKQKEDRLAKGKNLVLQLEKEIDAHPEYSKLYRKYKEIS